MAMRGEDAGDDTVYYSHATSFDNPFIPDSEIEQQRETMPDRVFRQEYLAEFQEDSGEVFPEIPTEGYDLGSRRGQAPYRIGVDYARHHDWTVITVLDSEGYVVELERVQQTSWHAIQKLIENTYERYNPATVQVDATRDNKITEDLNAAGIPVEPVKFTTAAKAEMVEDTAAMMESGEITIPTEAGTLRSELSAFEYSVTSHGNVTYHAPDDRHDDHVDSLCLAATAPEPMSASERLPSVSNRARAVLLVAATVVAVAGAGAGTGAGAGVGTGTSPSDPPQRAQTQQERAETTVSLDPSSVTVDAGETATYDLVVESADGGVGAYDFTVEAADATVASLTGVDLKGGPAGATTEISFAADNSSVDVVAALADTDDSGAVTVATVTVTGDASGTSDISLSIDALATEAGASYDITEVDDESITVEGENGDGDEENTGGGSAAETTTDEKTGEDGAELTAAEARSRIGLPEEAETAIEHAEEVTVGPESEGSGNTATFSNDSVLERISFDNPVDGTVTVAELEQPPPRATAPPGAGVTVLAIEPDVGVSDVGATIEFGVPTESVERTDAAAEDLQVTRFVDGESQEWESVETEVVGVGDGEITLRAETPDTSIFSVSAVATPEAAVEITPSAVEVGETVRLDASGSRDRYGEIVAFEWAVAGEATGGEQVTATFDTAGEVTVELTVRNGAGRTDTRTTNLTVSGSPDGGQDGSEKTPATDAGETDED
ncbi:hypothetical protein BRD22_02560, partial [Halobacteriales archaeon SW_8_68_21]